MAIAVPVGIGDKLVGTGFIAGVHEGMPAIVTALHLLGNSSDFMIGVPPHMGDVAQLQQYPLPTITVLPARLALAEPLLDIAVLILAPNTLMAPVPRYIGSPSEIQVGESVFVVGYPFAAIGSFLETVEPSHISALGDRLLDGGVHRLEFIISHQTFVGSSGSPVVRRSDGAVCGLVRGCLAPPGMISIGNLPLGTDTNVTYATSAHIIPALVAEAFSAGV